MISPFLLRAYTALRYAPHVQSVNEVEAKSVAIVFGARVMPSGRLSTMLRDRVATAADLYHAGKVSNILMSGDHHLPEYNEPGAMRDYAVRLGVPSEAILLDPAGLRTYDSCYRAKNLYHIENAILVSQAFHLDRALWLCEALGIEGVGVYADYHRPSGEYSRRSSRWSQWREVAATTVAFWDVLTRPAPILGDTMPSHYSTSDTAQAP